MEDGWHQQHLSMHAPKAFSVQFVRHEMQVWTGACQSFAAELKMTRFVADSGVLQSIALHCFERGCRASFRMWLPPDQSFASAGTSA